MIEGLHFDVSSDELKAHLQGRVRHHQERQSFYATQHQALAEGRAEAQPYTNGDPLKSLKDSETRHASQVERFQLMADHVVAGETYRLSDSNLGEVEFVRNWRGY